MTKFTNSECRTSSSLLFAALFTLLFVGFLTGCGRGDDASGGGAIENVALVPEAGYPGVEVGVNFEINPADGRDEAEFSWRVDFGDATTQSGDGLLGEARHSYSRTGAFTIRIDALYGGDLADSLEFSYSVYDPVDISVSSVTGQPNNLRVGETITVSSTVRNETAGPVRTPVTLRAYFSSSPTVSLDEISDLTVIGETTLSAEGDDDVLPGGGTRNVGINAPVPEISSGQYHVVVVVDPDNRIADSNPADNIAVSGNRLRVENLDEALPDISVDELDVAPGRAFPELNRVTRAFRLSNLGNVDIFNVVHKTYLQVGSDQLDDSAVLLHTSVPVNLSARQERLIGPEEFILPESIIPPSGEDVTVYLIVEAFSDDGDVEESRLDNNRIASPPIEVSDQPVEGPDIAVHHFEVSPSSTYLGGTLQIEATIANDGTQDVSSFFCGIYMGPEPRVRLDGDPRLTNINIPTLAAGDVREIERTVTIPTLYDPGVYYFYIVCDPNGALNEPYRGNNQIIQFDPITITDQADVDLFVEEVILPPSAQDGETIEVEALVCVSGTNASGITTGKLFQSSGLSIDYNSEPIKTFQIPNINPGECLEMSFQVQARCEDFQDQLNFGIFVDSEGVLPEQNTSNNRQAGALPISMQGRFCSCEDDDFGPNQRPLDAFDLDDGVYEASICQPGSCDFYAVNLQTGDTALVTVDFESARGALKTTMFAPGGVQELDSDDSPDQQQVGLFVSGGDLRYVFSVCGDGSDVMNYYDLDLEILPQPANVDVLPRNVTIPSQATFSLGAQMNVGFRTYNLGQEATGAFDARLFLTSSGELDDPSNIILGTYGVDSISGGAFRDISLTTSLPTLLSDGDYYIAVHLDPAGVLNEDNLDNNFAFSRSFTVETICYDAFSPNDSFSLAAPLSPATYNNLVACAGTSDYYEICAPNGHSVRARITFDSAQGDIDARLYNQNLEVIDTSAQSGVDLEEVNVDYVNGDQCYYLRVYLVSLDPDAETTYGLQLEINELPPELQCDGTFEPNDDFATATSLWSALQHEDTLNRCPKEDTDFYQVQLSSQSTVNFRALLDPPLQPGTLRLQLYRPNGTPDAFVETAPGVPVAEIADYEPPVTGRYFLQVTIGGDERRVDYRLEADGLPGVDLAADQLNIGPGSYTEGDVIRYGYRLRNFGGDDVSGITYRVYLSSSSSLDVSSAQLLGDFTAPDLGADASVQIDGQVNVPSNHGVGDYYFHVFIDPDDELDDVNRNNNRASIPITLVAPADDNDDNGDDGNGDLGS